MEKIFHSSTRSASIPPIFVCSGYHSVLLIDIVVVLTFDFIVSYISIQISLTLRVTPSHFTTRKEKLPMKNTHNESSLPHKAFNISVRFFTFTPFEHSLWTHSNMKNNWIFIPDEFVRVHTHTHAHPHTHTYNAKKRPSNCVNRIKTALLRNETGSAEY